MTALAHEAWVLTGRNVRLSLSTRGIFQLAVSPLMFFVGFYAVLEKLLSARGIDFGQFLPTAIIVQAMGFASSSTAFFIAADRGTGMLARCRTLPINGAAVVIARLAADAVRCLVPIAVSLAAGYAIGFRFTGGPAAAGGFLLLSVAFALAFAAGAAALGLRSRDPEAVSMLLFMPMVVLLNLSSVLVPRTAFPDWLEPVVGINPYTAVADALRALASGSGIAATLGPAVAWVAGLSLVFGWAATRAVRRSPV